MPRIKFAHIFTLLMLLSFLSAFVIPPSSTQSFKPNVQALFVPVSWPAAGIGRWASGRFGDPAWDDRRGGDEIKAENAELKAMVMNLTIRLKQEEEKSAQRATLSPRLRDHGDFVSVVGGDTGTRQTLQLRPPIPTSVANGMYATYSGGVAGVVQNAGVGGARIQLVTDVGFKVKCGFARLRKNAQGRLELVPIATPAVVVEGAGDNTLRVFKTGVTVEDAKSAGLIDRETGKTAEGLWAYVNDRDWPELLAGQPVARVEKVVPREDMPLFAEVTLHPATNLMRLREVFVVTKE